MPGRRVRRLRRQNKSLRQKLRKASRLDVVSPLTNRRLRKEMNAATRLRYRPEKLQIQAEQRGSDQRQGQITDWYANYKTARDTALAQQQAAQADANAAITALQTNAQTQDDAARTQAQQTAAAGAASRGIDPSTAATDAFAADVNAAAARRAGTSSFGSMLATQGAARDAYMIDQGRVAAGDETQQHLAESKRRSKLDVDMRELQADKGAFRAQYRADAREKERRNALEQAAFGLNQQKAAVDASLAASAQKSLDRDRKADNRRDRREERRQNMEDDRKFQLDKDKFGADQAKENYQRRHGLGPYKQGGAKDNVDDKTGLTPYQRRQRRKESNSAFSKVNSAASDMGTLSKSPYTDDKGTEDEGDDVKRHASREETFSALRRSPYGYSQDEIIVAYAMHHGKKTWNEWDAKTKAAAKRLGIRPSSAGGKGSPSSYKKSHDGSRPD